MTYLKPGFPELPVRMRSRPIDDRGYPVPWFVGKTDAGWDFRVIRPDGIALAILRDTCWLCGDRLGRHKVFCIGPMCAITRTTSEPPSHLDCAEFAVKACPFLSNPDMRRSPRPMPEGSSDPAGIHIPRNPGVTCLWTTETYKTFPVAGGRLIKLGDPSHIAWWARGRTATREEVEESVNTGLPLLQKQAMEDSAEAVVDLAKRAGWFRANLLPA